MRRIASGTPWSAGHLSAFRFPMRLLSRPRFREAAIAPEAFADALQQVAPVWARILSPRNRASIHADMDSGRHPLSGLRFQGFTSAPALELARKARSGDMRAKTRISQIVTRGLLNESLL